MGALQGQEEKWGQWARVWAAAESQALPLIAGGTFLFEGFLFVCSGLTHHRLGWPSISQLFSCLSFLNAGILGRHHCEGPTCFVKASATP